MNQSAKRIELAQHSARLIEELGYLRAELPTAKAIRVGYIGKRARQITEAVDGIDRMAGALEER